MLGKRSRPIQKTPSQLHLSPDRPSDSSDHSEDKPKFFNTPRVFIGFNTPKGGLDSEAVRSPTSPLDIKTFSGVGISYWYDKQVRSPRSGLEGLQCVSPRPWEKRDSEGIGLGIVVALHNSSSNNEVNNGGGPALANSRGLLLGSQLKIVIGSNQNLLTAQKQLSSPKAQILSPHPHLNSVHAYLKLSNTQSNSSNPLPSFPLKKTDPIPIESNGKPSSQTGMEHSESYTCVTSHGPKSSTKRIYNHCSLESETIHSAKSKQQDLWSVGSPPPSPPRCANAPQFPSADFLSACYLCKRHLSPGKDIYMYRGDRAFCSVECRCQQIMMDERSEAFPASPPSSANEISFCGRFFSKSTAAAA